MADTNEGWPLFNHRLDIDTSLEEMWHSGATVNDDSLKEFRLVEWQGYALEIIAHKQNESFLSKPDVMKQNFLDAGEHVDKLVEFGLNTLSYAYEAAKRRQRLGRLLRPGQDDRIIGFSASPEVNVDDVQLLSPHNTLAEQMPAEQAHRQVVEPALKYIDWWLNQTEHSSLFTHLGFPDSYAIYVPANQLYLLDHRPTFMSDVGTTFRESHVKGAFAIQNYRDTIQSLASQ